MRVTDAGRFDARRRAGPKGDAERERSRRDRDVTCRSDAQGRMQVMMPGTGPRARRVWRERCREEGRGKLGWNEEENEDEDEDEDGEEGRVERG